jgi:UDPglucose 6-dehydrogenase
MKKIDVVVVGLWHQGIVAAACLADKGYNVVGLDSSITIIKKLSFGKSPIYEPGLDNLIIKGIKKKKLIFTNDFNVTQNAKYVLLAHDIPVNNYDEVNLKNFFNDIHAIAPFIKNQILHITAQLPAGTSNEILKLINKKNSNFKSIAYSPENLRLGHAISRYQNPPLPVIGSNDDRTFQKLSLLYKPFSKRWEKTDLLSAEFLKHALNTFLATSITFANEIGNITDAMGANGYEVGRLLKLEPRIGKYAFTRPGMGFSGGTLARDVKALLNFSKKNELNSNLLKGIWKSNKNQNLQPIKIINQVFKQTPINKKVAILGLTYKADTSTLRRSLSIDIIKKLTVLGYKVSSYDPKADRKELKKHPSANFSESLNDVFKNADLILAITPWKDFLNLDFAAIRKLVKNNYFFDISGQFEKEIIEKHNFKFLSIGSGSVYMEAKKQ